MDELLNRVPTVSGHAFAIPVTCVKKSLMIQDVFVRHFLFSVCQNEAEKRFFARALDLRLALTLIIVKESIGR